MHFEQAEDIVSLIKRLVEKLEMDHIVIEQVACVRSRGSVARAYARIWGLARIFQMAFGHKPVYVIEVLSEHFDKLSHEDKIKTLIHELLHIPKTFSGALLSHKGKNRRINHTQVNQLYKQLQLISD